jgi:hypothetical protein
MTERRRKIPRKVVRRRIKQKMMLRERRALKMGKTLNFETLFVWGKVN